jgi:hypothetical protein
VKATQIFSFKNGQAHKYSDMEPPAFVAIYQGRVDGDFDHIVTVNTDGVDERRRFAGDIANRLAELGEEVIVIESDSNDFPDVYEPQPDDDDTPPDQTCAALAFARMNLAIDIPEHAWKPSGDYPEAGNDPTSRLSADIDFMLNGASMCVEAYATDIDPKFPDEQRVVDQDLDGILTTLVGEASFPLATTTIRDREYIIIITPRRN